MPESKEEKDHWASVLKAYDGYMQYHLSANHARRMAFLQLPRAQRDIYESIGFREKLDAVDEGIRRNAEFIEQMIQDPVFADVLAEGAADHGHSHDHGGHGHSHGDNGGHGGHGDHQHTHGESSSSSSGVNDNHHSPTDKSPQNRDLPQDKVRSVLRSFVRDWSEQGRAEREACYDPILQTLTALFPEERQNYKVLVPGCGLGRLAMEIASLGFASQGNEFSTYMLIASHFILNQSTQPNQHSIFPFLHSYSNHKTTESHLLRRIFVPDVLPSQVLSDQSVDFSLVAGDFEEIYGAEEQKGEWAAVITCFFIDCARNPLRYLQIIYDLLPPSGIWINLGPLLWHFENSGLGPTGEGSIELSLDELKELAMIVGFEIEDVSMVETTYTGVPDGMLQHKYNCAFFVAHKRAKEEDKNEE